MNRPPTIVALGDSLTEGFGVAPGQTYPERLHALLAHNGIQCRMVNAGISGDTCRNVLRRLPAALAFKPDLVILEIGINDILMGALPETIRRTIAAIVETLQARGITVLLAGMTLPPLGDPESETAFAAVYPELAETFGLTLIPSFTDPVWSRADRVQTDGIHPTAAGYTAIAAHMLPWVVQALSAFSNR
jgi:acyl-CoA thioesterase-1